MQQARANAACAPLAATSKRISQLPGNLRGRCPRLQGGGKGLEDKLSQFAGANETRASYIHFCFLKP